MKRLDECEQHVHHALQSINMANLTSAIPQNLNSILTQIRVVRHPLSPPFRFVVAKLDLART